MVTPALRWLEETSSGSGHDVDEIVRVEHQRQAAMNVTVRNVITSMRLISAFDWAEFFESVSLVDAILWTDTGFAAPDFVTRDRYRDAIEELSRRSTHDEREIARRAVLQAKRFRSEAQGSGDPTAERRADPGYYLIANGRVAFEQELGFRMPIKTRLRRAYVTQRDVSVPWQPLRLSVVSSSTLFLFNSGAGQVGIAGLFLVGLLALVPASDLAIALVNREVTELLGPRALPRLALRDGVPSDLRTLVVVPTLLTDHAQIAEQIERLEVHYLANSDGDLRFALLSDWTDAPQENLPGDDELLAASVDGIAQLNRRHGPRQMGASDFSFSTAGADGTRASASGSAGNANAESFMNSNRLLRGDTDTTFVPTGGRAPIAPSGVRYVITLDADTRLPRGSRLPIGRHDGASPQSAAV